MNLSELRKRPHISASQINQLLNICSLQYYFERVARLKKPFVSHSLVFGTCIHRVLEQHFLQLKAGRTPDLELHLDMFSKLWKKANDDQTVKFDAKDDFDSLADKGREMIRCFADNINPEEKVLSVSQAFCVPVHAPDGSIVELPLIGEFDLVVEQDGVPVIKDWKTAARKWPKDHADKSFQATAYSYAWNQMYGERPEIRFDVVTKTKTPSFEQHPTRRTEEQEQRMALMISKAQQIVKHGLYYPAETGFYCDGCPYADACATWHQQCPSAASQAA